MTSQNYEIRRTTRGLTVTSADIINMFEWLNDFATCTLENVISSRESNNAWSNELRLRINALMDSKLASEISQEEYASKRKIANEEVAECKRRKLVLAHEMWRRGRGKKLSLTDRSLPG